TAYGRRERCEAFDRQLRALRADRTDVWPGEFVFVAGARHSGLPDRDRLTVLLRQQRGAMPHDLVFEPTDDAVHQHFWLAVDQGGGGRRVEASLTGAELTVRRTGAAAVTVRLDARLADFAVPLTIRAGEAVQQRSLSPSLRVL